MGARGLDDLNTGNNGQELTFGNEEPSNEQKQAVEAQQVELRDLMPGVESIQVVLDGEIEAVGDIRSYITELGEKATAEKIHDEYRARELYIGLIKRLKQGIDDKVAMAEAEVNK
jgi:allophanate hydrolase subunit 1